MNIEINIYAMAESNDQGNTLEMLPNYHANSVEIRILSSERTISGALVIINQKLDP
jgi:hypothetical protein